MAIFSEPQPVNLFKFFWSELSMKGVRVYEPEDYEIAISLIASKKLPLPELITSTRFLAELPDVFNSLEVNPNQMKVIIDCSDV